MAHVRRTTNSPTPRPAMPNEDSRETTRTKNRRISPRRATKQSVKAICRKGSLGLGPNIAVAVLDISETGTRLLLKEALLARQEVEVCLLPPGLVREFKLPGRVVWCVPAADGNFCTGIEFEKYLSYSAL